MAYTYRYQHTQGSEWTTSTSRWDTIEEAGVKVGEFMSLCYAHQVYPVTQLVQVDDGQKIVLPII